MDLAGNPLTSPVTFNFFFLNADANHDRTVDTLDFNALAANFGTTGRTFSQADFNYDGAVDTLDFNSLAANFGRSLPPPTSVALIHSPAPVAAMPFGSTPFASDRATRNDESLLVDVLSAPGG
jgi:hypothetical protein